MLKLKDFKFEYNIRNKNREQRDGTYGKKWWEKLLILGFSAFVATPLTIFYWAAAWDIMYYYVWPYNPGDQWNDLISCLICGGVSKVFLLIFYLTQNKMQSFHDHFYDRNTSYFKIIAYFVRMSYAFVLCFVYVLQYRFYWDTYNLLTDCVADYKYYFALAIVTILAYRYMLEGDFSSYSKTVPFELTIDGNHKTFFLQGTFVKLKNKWLQKIANYFYFEWIEMLIAIFVWKGIFDVVETGFPLMFGGADNCLVDEYKPDLGYFIAIGFTGLISYSFFFLFTLFKDFIRFESDKYLKKFSHFFLDFIDFLAYWAMVGCWSLWWDAYDTFAEYVVPKEYYAVFFFGSLCLIFSLCAMLGIVSNLFGPAGSVDNEDEDEINENPLKNEEKSNSKIKAVKFNDSNNNGITYL